MANGLWEGFWSWIDRIEAIHSWGKRIKWILPLGGGAIIAVWTALARFDAPIAVTFGILAGAGLLLILVLFLHLKDRALLHRDAPTTAVAQSATVIHVPNDVTAEYVVSENRRLQQLAEDRAAEQTRNLGEIETLRRQSDKQEAQLRAQTHSAERTLNIYHDMTAFQDRLIAQNDDASETMDRVETALERIFDVPDGPISYDDAIEAQPLSPEDRINRALQAIYSFRQRRRDGSHPLGSDRNCMLHTYLCITGQAGPQGRKNG